MEKGKVITIIAVACLFIAAFMLTGKEKPTAGNGKALFKSTVIGRSGKTCSSCHPGGKGLESVALKTEWNAGGEVFQSIEGAINACVRGALKGRSLQEDSLETQSLALYLDGFRQEQAAPVVKKVVEEEEDDEDKFGC